MKPHKHAELIKANLHKFVFIGSSLCWSGNFGPRARAGMPVGSTDSSGYLQVKLGGFIIFVHRVVWLMYNDSWPEQIDHIDRNRKNNVIENLRASNNSLNQHNASKRKDNTTGQAGVHCRDERYVARLSFNKKRHQIGTYKTLEEASSAYLKFKEKMLSAGSQAASTASKP